MEAQHTTMSQTLKVDLWEWVMKVDHDVIKIVTYLENSAQKQLQI